MSTQLLRIAALRRLPEVDAARAVSKEGALAAIGARVTRVEDVMARLDALVEDINEDLRKVGWVLELR